MESFFATTVEALEFSARVLTDSEPSPEKIIDAIYIYGETEDNRMSPLALAAELSSITENVAFLKSGTLVTGKTFECDYDDLLIGMGVSEKKIVCTRLSEGFAHTHTEAIALIKVAKSKNWKTIYVIAPPFHLLRCFAETITAVKSIYPELAVYAKASKPISWTERVVHCQDVLQGKRSELILTEFQRLDAYHAKGDLLTARQILDYLNQRDGDQ